MSEFKPGDVVRIVRKTPDFNGEWHNEWIPEMEALIGSTETFRVLSSDEGGVRFNLNNLHPLDGLGFDPNSLEFVATAATNIIAKRTKRKTAPAQLLPGQGVW